MKVIIPVAGLGCRMRPHSYSTPKSLLKVAGVSVLGHILKWLENIGDIHVVFIVGHLREQIEEYLATTYRGSYEVRLQSEPKGLGDAVSIGLDDDDRDVFITLGDVIVDKDLREVVRRGVSSVGVKRVSDPSKMGVVELENNLAVRMIEKPSDPPSNLALVGLYYLSDGALLKKAIQETVRKGIARKGKFQITDALQVLLDWNVKIETFEVENWFDCGRPESILDANGYFLKQATMDMDRADYRDCMRISPNITGNKTQIEHSMIGANVSIGERCQIRDSIIRDSIIGDDCIIEGALLERSIIGNRVELNGRLKKLNLGNATQLEF